MWFNTVRSWWPVYFYFQITKSRTLKDIKLGQQYSCYQLFCYRLYIYIYRKKVSSFHHSISSSFFNSIFCPLSPGAFFANKHSVSVSQHESLLLLDRSLLLWLVGGVDCASMEKLTRTNPKWSLVNKSVVSIVSF